MEPTTTVRQSSNGLRFLIALAVGFWLGFAAGRFTRSEPEPKLPALTDTNGVAWKLQ